MPHKYVRIDGVATYLHHTGATTLPEAPPATDRGEVLLCLHGTGGHGGDFQGLFSELGEDHSPIAFDQPGHGRSGSLDSLGAVDRMRSFTRALVEKLGLRAPVLVGHSLGAAVAVDYALAHPGEVRGLVICAGGGGFRFPDDFIENARLVTEGKRRRDFDPSLFCKKTDPKLMRKAFMSGLKTDPRATYGDLLACRDWQPGDLASLSVPTLVLHGDSETEEVVAQALDLVEAAPDARKAVVADAGRMFFYEQPAAVAAEIRAFAEGLS